MYNTYDIRNQINDDHNDDEDDDDDDNNDEDIHTIYATN